MIDVVVYDIARVLLDEQRDCRCQSSTARPYLPLPCLPSRQMALCLGYSKRRAILRSLMFDVRASLVQTSLVR